MQEIDQEQFPFLTGITYANSEYYGIVVNYDNTILTMYDLSKMPDKETRSLFVTLGETWWWESNRMLPIDVFLHHRDETFSKVSNHNGYERCRPYVWTNDYFTKYVKETY